MGESQCEFNLLRSRCEANARVVASLERRPPVRTHACPPARPPALLVLSGLLAVLEGFKGESKRERLLWSRVRTSKRISAFVHFDRFVSVDFEPLPASIEDLARSVMIIAFRTLSTLPQARRFENPSSRRRPIETAIRRAGETPIEVSLSAGIFCFACLSGQS